MVTLTNVVYVTPKIITTLRYLSLIDLYINEVHSNKKGYNVIECYSRNKTNNRNFPILF